LGQGRQNIGKEDLLWSSDSDRQTERDREREIDRERERERDMREREMRERGERERDENITHRQTGTERRKRGGVDRFAHVVIQILRCPQTSDARSGHAVSAVG